MVRAGAIERGKLPFRRRVHYLVPMIARVAAAVAYYPIMVGIG